MPGKVYNADCSRIETIYDDLIDVYLTVDVRRIAASRLIKIKPREMKEKK